MPRTRSTRTRTKTSSTAKKPASSGDRAAKPVTLDDLSPADRRRLAAEAAGAAKSDGGSVDERAEKTREAIASRIDARDHLRDCPVGEGEIGRVEVYPEVRPARPADGIPKQPVTVARCIECGGTTVLEQPHAEVMAEIEEEVNA